MRSRTDSSILFLGMKGRRTGVTAAVKKKNGKLFLDPCCCMNIKVPIIEQSFSVSQDCFPRRRSQFPKLWKQLDGLAQDFM